MSARSMESLIDDAPGGRFAGIRRDYGVDQVVALRGTLPVRYSLAEHAANRLWHLLTTEDYVHALGAMTGGQAVQMVRAGLKAIYLSGWQVAADANGAGQTYPDQSLYPADSGPQLARRINRALQRADQIDSVDGLGTTDWFAPILADAEAGFGGPLNAFEIAKAYIEAGVGGIHFEDQLASEKKCGHMGGKVLIPTQAHIRNLSAARLAADVCGTATVILARTDADSAKLITSDIDERDRPSSPASARRKASIACATARAWRAASPAASPSRPTPTCCGWRPRPPTSARRGPSPRPSSATPWQDARLQLLALVQLAGQHRRAHHRPLPARARRHGLQVPVRHARGLPQPEPRHVRAGAGLP